MGAAVDVGTKINSIVVYLPQCPHAEGLKSAAVGQHWAVPTHEFLNSTHIVDRAHPWPQV